MHLALAGTCFHYCYYYATVLRQPTSARLRRSACVQTDLQDFGAISFCDSTNADLKAQLWVLL